MTFCLKALEEALARHGKPEIFNTDQGSQFTSLPFTQILTDANIRISMDGPGRWIEGAGASRRLLVSLPRFDHCVSNHLIAPA